MRNVVLSFIAFVFMLITLQIGFYVYAAVKAITIAQDFCKDDNALRCLGKAGAEIDKGLKGE